MSITRSYNKHTGTYYAYETTYSLTKGNEGCLPPLQQLLSLFISDLQMLLQSMMIYIRKQHPMACCLTAPHPQTYSTNQKAYIGNARKRI